MTSIEVVSDCIHCFYFKLKSAVSGGSLVAETEGLKVALIPGSVREGGELAALKLALIERRLGWTHHPR